MRAHGMVVEYSVMVQAPSLRMLQFYLILRLMYLEVFTLLMVLMPS